MVNEPYTSEALPVITDLHGNLEGFLKIMSFLRERQVNRPPLFLGDLLWTQHRSYDVFALLDRLMNVEATAFVSGNTDSYLVNGWLEAWEPRTDAGRSEKEHMLSLKARMTSRQKDFIRNFLPSYSFVMAGRRCFGCHASPLNNEEGFTLDLPPTDINLRLAGVDTDCLITGHLHRSFSQQLGKRQHFAVGAGGRHPQEFDGIVDFGILDQREDRVVMVYNRILQ